MIWGNDPNYNYIPSTPEFQKEWVETIVKNFHSASQGGVKFYQMDNEPGLWGWNHRDVRPQGLGYDDMVELNADYAEAVKEADPDAKVIGMTAWGVKELAGSAWDFMPGGKEGYKLGEGAIKDKLDRPQGPWRYAPGGLLPPGNEQALPKGGQAPASTTWTTTVSPRSGERTPRART